MKKFSLKTVFWVAVCSLFIGFAAQAALNQKPKNYDGIVTQVNVTDGSFVLRLRDGSLVTVNPFAVNTFMTVRGVLDPGTGALGQVSEIKVKDENAPDKIPLLSIIDPGSGQVGTKIILTGSGFTKKNNSISIGDVRNSVIKIPSVDGKTLSFRLPASPCNQLLKTNCPTQVIPPGNYNIAVSNQNGLSNAVSFSVLPLPPLTITTDLLQQTVTDIKTNLAISAMGGAESYNWRISQGILPPGLMLAQAACTETPCRTNAIISGTPTAPGTYQFTVTLNSGGENISRQFSLVIVQGLNNPGY